MLWWMYVIFVLRTLYQFGCRKRWKLHYLTQNNSRTFQPAQEIGREKNSADIHSICTEWMDGWMVAHTFTYTFTYEPRICDNWKSYYLSCTISFRLILPCCAIAPLLVHSPKTTVFINWSVEWRLFPDATSFSPGPRNICIHAVIIEPNRCELSRIASYWRQVTTTPFPLNYTPHNNSMYGIDFYYNLQIYDRNGATTQFECQQAICDPL